MLLKPDDCRDFIRLHRKLMFFVGRKMDLIPRNVKDPEDYGTLPPLLRTEIQQAFGSAVELWINSYLDKEAGLSDEDRNTVLSWKRAVHGRFILLRQLKNYAVFFNDGEEWAAYGVVGLSEPFSEMVGGRFPVMVEATLFPFRGQITYGSTLKSFAISFGANIKRGFNQTFQQLKSEGRFFTSLESMPESGVGTAPDDGGGAPEGKAGGKSGKTSGPAQRLKRLVAAVNKNLKEVRLRKAQCTTFETEVLPAFRTWVEENFGESRKKARLLEEEIDGLAKVLAEIRFGLITGSYQSGEEAVEAALQLLEEEQEARGFVGGEDSPDARDDDEMDEDGGFGENPAENIPGPVLRKFFSDLMWSMRNIDIDQLAPDQHSKFYQEFIEALGQMQGGDMRSFEKAILRVGADDSEENLSAVNKIYRRLARQIHPDRNTDFCAEAHELWDELKLAREAKSLSGLEKIEIHWRVLRKETFAEEEEPLLRRFQKMLSADLKALKRAAKQHANHPMWGKAAGDPPPDELKRLLARDLELRLKLLLEEKEEMERAIDELRGVKRRSERKKNSPARPGPAAKPKARGSRARGQ